MAKKRGSPDPVEKIKAIMNNRRTPVQVQLRAAIALLDHENGKGAIAGEPGLGEGGKNGLSALLLRAQMENKRSTPSSGRPPAGDLKSARRRKPQASPPQPQNRKRRRPKRPKKPL